MKPVVIFWRVALALCLFLPLVGTAQQQETQQQRAQSQPGNNAPVWRDVRSGREEYTSVKGRETGVLMQTYGETWRQLRNAWITPIGGWVVALIAALIGAFHWFKGAVKLHDKLSGRLIERFTAVERYAHWTMGISFAILGVTGLIMFVGKYVLLPVIGYTLFGWLTQLSKHLHNFVGPLFVLSLVVFIVMFIRDNLPKAYDFSWFASAGGMFGGKHVASGRFNAGEKLWFWAGVVALSLLVSASGLILNFPNFDQTRAIMIESNVVHAISACAVMALSLGHIYMGSIGVDGAYESMRYGYVDEAWAREHHELWYNDVKSGKVKAGTATGASVSPQTQH
jgi:formate dehydrogenase subunit gamma